MSLASLLHLKSTSVQRSSTITISRERGWYLSYSISWQVLPMSRESLSVWSVKAGLRFARRRLGIEWSGTSAPYSGMSLSLHTSTVTHSETSSTPTM